MVGTADDSSEWHMAIPDISIFLIVAVLALIVIAGVAFALGNRRRDASGEVAGLAGRLDQMAVAQATLQDIVNNRLQDFGKNLGDSFTTLADRLGEDLKQGADDTGKSLSELRVRLALIDSAQANIQKLSDNVADLAGILGNKQARGTFGETQLADIVQSALPAQNYDFQVQIGAKRVDCLLRLPNPPGPIAIDAKFPLEAWRAIREAADETQMAEARRQFATAIRVHVRAIAEQYIVPGETADSALMFLPSEAVYAELHAGFPQLVEEAGRMRVWIVSPTTLMATLTTIRSVLKDVRMREQAHLIQIEVGKLAKDVERLDDRVKNLQKHFDQANSDMREIGISTRKIVDRAARIGDIEAAADTQQETLPGPDPAQTRLN